MTRLETFSKKITSSFTFIGIIIAIIAPFIFIFNYLQTYLKNHVMWSVLVDIRNQLCEHLLPQTLSYFENRKSGELISRLTNDITATQSALSILFDSTLLLPMRLFCGLGLAFYSKLEAVFFYICFIPTCHCPCTDFWTED